MFRGGVVLKAHRLLYHSTLGSRVMRKKKTLTKAESRLARAFDAESAGFCFRLVLLKPKAFGLSKSAFSLSKT